MSDSLNARCAELQRRMADDGLDLFVFDDADSIFYLSGFWGYLGMEFGRATLLAVPCPGEPTLITPAMEAEMARTMSWVADIRAWADGVDGEWPEALVDLVRNHAPRSIAVEAGKAHPAVQRTLRQAAGGAGLTDGSRLIGSMRMIKGPEEIAIMRQAGQVAVAMGRAGHEAIGEGVPEFEVALAVIEAGTRKAAEFLSENGPDRLVSPTIHNLQVLQSGHHTCMVHRRSTVRRLAEGDPVYLCFCGIANFKQYKLGFDREFFVGSATDEQARVYETAVAAQQAALSAIRPGVTAEEVHLAAEEVYRSAGHGPAYRTGRGIGCSFLEEPQIKGGDRTRLMPGMTFAVDGGITVPGEFGARVGDSILVTDEGFEYLTDYPRGLTVV
jgi:Xaa-Pro aminopeptidase